jgi:O-antigen ligase
MPLILIIGLLVAFAGLSWRDLKLALVLIIGLLPSYLVRFEIGIPWTLLEGFILIAFTVWLARGHGRGMDLRQIFKQYLYPAVFLLTIATLAIIWAPDLNSALGVWKAYFIEPALMFVMLRSIFTTREDWIKALTGLGLTVIMIAGFAIFQKLTGLGLPIPWDLERRTTSIFEYPNAVGLFVAPVVAALLVVRPKIAYLAVPLGLIAIMLSETEAALVAIPCALLITLLITKIQPKIKIATLIGVAVASTILLASVTTIREKVLLQDYSGGVRLSQWSETVELLKDRPLQGAGLSGYPTVFAPYHDPTLYEIFQYPHNVILNFWVEMGIFGVLAFVLIAIATTKLAWTRRDDVLVLAAFAALLTMTIHGLVDVPFFKNDLAVLSVFFLAMTSSPATKPHSPS